MSLLLRLLALLGLALAGALHRPVHASAQPPLSLAVRGNHLINARGLPVVLRGANSSGTEYACVSQNSIFDGNEEASPGSVAAMRAWGFNAVRVQLNESCWLGIQGVKPAYSGDAYRRAIEQYVSELNAAGMYVIVDLHFSSTGGRQKAVGQVPMPDERYAAAFWRSVASTFKGNPAVAFDLFNEPYPDRNADSPAAWSCDLYGSAGGTCTGFGYRAAGMQALLDAVRETGASNVVMVGGPQYAGDLDRFAQYAPQDPLAQLAASIHIYWKSVPEPEWSPCYASSCWNDVLAPKLLLGDRRGVPPGNTRSSPGLGAIPPQLAAVAQLSSPPPPVHVLVTAWAAVADSRIPKNTNPKPR